MSYDLPGPGDSATWGPVTDPRDPRYVDPAENECGSMLIRMKWAHEHLERAICAAENLDPTEARASARAAILDLQEALE